MNTKQINDQAINSLNTYFIEHQNNKTCKENDHLLSPKEITNIVKEEIKVKKSKIASLEVLRKNIAIDAKESLYKTIGNQPSKKATGKKITVDEMAIKLQKEKIHQMEVVNKLKEERLEK